MRETKMRDNPRAWNRALRLCLRAMAAGRPSIPEDPKWNEAIRYAERLMTASRREPCMDRSST